MKAFLTILTLFCIVGCEPADRICDPGETQSCLCPTGDLGSQSCSDDGSRWRGCSCGTTPPPVSDAGVSSSCRSSGQVVLSCGCWGPAYEGQIRTVAGCCSGRAYSTAVGCFGACTGGGVPWGNICL